MPVMCRVFVIGGLVALGVARPNFHDHELDWDYGTERGPSNWEDLYPGCGGFCQSPVALPATWDNATFLRRFGWYEFGHNRTYTIENDGRRLIVGYKADHLPAPYFKGALFDPKVRFQFHKMILHWGSDSTRGSEHSIAGWQYPGEMQFIGWDTRYGSYEKASTIPGGIAIAVFLIQLSKEDNSNFDWLLDNVWKVNGVNKEAELGVGDLHWVFPVEAADASHDCEFFLYEGSSSFPPCNEVAVWIVYRDATSLSERQFNILRSLTNGSGQHINDNFRPIQPLHGRKVWQHREVDSNGSDRPTARPIRPDDRSTSTQSKTILTDYFHGRIKDVAPHGFNSYQDFQLLRDEVFQGQHDHRRQQHERKGYADRGIHGHDSEFRYVKPYRGPIKYDPTEGGYGR